MAQDQISDGVAQPARGRSGRDHEKKKRSRRDPEGRMALNEHLIELRNRLAICAIAVLLLAIVGWIVYPWVFEFLKVPFRHARDLNINAELNFQGIGTGLSVKLQMSAYIGLILAAPIVLYEVWMFIVPGLHRNERRYALGFFGSAVPLFFAGCAAGYYMIIKAVPILMSFTPQEDQVKQLVNYGDYLKMLVKTVLAFGIAFDLPVVLVLLNFLGILSGRSMLKAWRWVVFLCFAFTAVMVPTPDPFTMIAMTAPMVLLYFAAVVISLLHDRRRAHLSGEDLDDDQASTIDDAPEAVDGSSRLDEDDER